MYGIYVKLHNIFPYEENPYYILLSNTIPLANCEKIISRDNFTLLMLKKLNTDVFMYVYISIQAQLTI